MYNPFSYASLGMPGSKEDFDKGATYVRSHIISPLALACLRASIAVYIWSTLIVGYSWITYNDTSQPISDIGLPTLTLLLDKAFIAKSFSYFTFITYWSLAFYFSVSAWHTFVYAFNLRRGRAGSISYLHDFFPRPLQLAHAIWHTTITTFPFLVTLVFWTTLYAIPWSTSSTYVRFINVSIHGLNSLFAILEIIFSATAPPPFLSHLLMVNLLLAMYLGLAYLTKLTQNFYVYPWMAPMFGWQGIVAHVFGYGGGMAVIYAVVWGVKLGRERVVDRLERRREGHAQSGDMESGRTTPCGQFPSGETSKAHSLDEKSVWVELHKL